MAEDPHNQRFFSYLSMFTFFMLILVAGDNYFIMFIGWEGIGCGAHASVGTESEWVWGSRVGDPDRGLELWEWLL
jgi:NADH:ubiquinone oxidoreductase subunit 5 (subunit L)/multisubunit Na+/H+ antiporter MnhA subunit